MKQFQFFILNAAGLAIFDLVDSSFGNNLGIDSICVMSAFTIIMWCVNIICNIGKYAYEVKMKYLSECFTLQIVASSIASISLLLLCEKLPYVYHLTEEQYQLLSKCLFWFAVPLVIRSAASFLGTYFLLNCKNRLILVSNSIYYIVMIGLDALVLFLHRQCYYLVITTGVAWVIYFIFIFFFGRFRDNLRRPNYEHLKECLIVVRDRMIDRVVGKVVTVVFNAVASHLGTELYALHSIGYAIATTSERMTDIWYQYQIVCLCEITSIKEKYKKYKEVRKKTALPIVIACYCLLLALIWFMHGKTDLKTALLFACLYETQSIFLITYENARGFLTSVGDTKTIRYGGLVGIIVRMPIVLISYYSPLGLYGFALASGIDFMFRGLYYSLSVRHYVQTEG